MNKYKIAWKSLGGITSASFRYRALLPCKYLKQKDYPCEIFNYKNLEQYKIVIFQKLYDYESINLVQILKSQGVITVFDLCDNLFHYQLNDLSVLNERIIRLQKMIDSVDIISVSTPELKKLICSKTDKIPVVIDDALEIPQINPLGKAYLKLKQTWGTTLNKRNNYLNVVWYGTSGTKNPPYGLIDLAKILPSLEKVHQEIPINLTVISNSQSTFNKYLSSAKIPVKYYNWKLNTFPYLFKYHDVCIIPVNINSLTKCKTNNRLVLSLLLDVPVIADRLPSYEEFGEFVLFSDWETNLRKYAFNQSLRQQHIKEGKEYILSKYDKNRVISQWSGLFEKLLN
jgi:hypothetical protein